MSNLEYDRAREERITYEVFVDAYTEDEQALCWYHYLANKLNFPFQARWEDRTVEVTGMSGESEEDGSDVRLEVLYREENAEDIFPVLAADLEPIDADEETVEALADLRYGIAMGY